jgi:hypothetical protein
MSLDSFYGTRLVCKEIIFWQVQRDHADELGGRKALLPSEALTIASALPSAASLCTWNSDGQAVAISEFQCSRL